MSSLLARLFSGLTQEGITLPSGEFQSASQIENAPPDFNLPSLDAAPQPSTKKKPTFMQASHTGPGGTPNALAPQLSTKGKILTTLLSAAAGGISAIGQPTAGRGFQQGLQLPFLQAQMRQGAEHGQLENEMLQEQMQYAPLLRMLGIQKTQSDIAQTQAQTAAIPSKTALEDAQREAAYYKDDPNLGLIDLRTGQPVNNSGTAPLEADEAAVLGKQAGERVPLKLKNTANEIVNRGRTTVQTEEGVFDYNRRTGEKKRLGSNPRMVFSPENRFVPIAPDPNNPGFITYGRVGEAARKGYQAPQSAQPTAAKAVARSNVPTKAGDLKVAFNTAIQHADLLQQAATALQNGNQQTLNSLKNKLANEFGSSGPVTAQAIADAYGREITAMLAKGHITDNEVESVGRTLNPNRQSMGQVRDVIKAYRALAQSKLNMLTQQERSAVGAGDQAQQPPMLKIIRDPKTNRIIGVQ